MSDRYIAWNGGTTVYALDPVTWVWSTVLLYSGNTVTPTAPNNDGTYGRMRYIPSKNAFVVVNATNENVYFFKLSSGSTPAPTVTLTSSASSVAYGGNATLTWSSTNATSCTASDAWTGAKAVSDSQNLTSMTTSGTYTLTCSGAGGSAAQSTSIAVNPMAGAAAITTVQLSNETATVQTNGVVTFGHYFRAGDVPSGYTVQAKTAAGASVELQVDKKATHADGSLRHAILSVRLASLAGNGSEILTLSSVPDSAAGAPVTLSSLLASSFDAQISLTVGGLLHSASAKTLLSSGTPQVWLSGPLVSEWIVGGPVRTVGGVAHPHLNAYFHVRAYAGLTRVSVDLIVENNWTLVPLPADQTYDATLSVGGIPVYSQTALSHYSHTRWHQRAWWGSDPHIYAKLNTAYLQDSKAIPKYETLTPTEAFLNSVRQSTAPMDNGDHTNYMDNTGAQDAIGPLPRWDAVYAVSADKRAFNYMKANADGGAAYPIHFRNEITQLPATIDSYPNASLADPVASLPPIPVPGSANPHDPGSFSSHQPSIGYLPYLVTGDYYYLEEMQFWSAYNLLWVGSSARAGRPGYGGNGATGIWYDGTIRGIAWAYRNLAQAASITPDAHALKSYFTTKLNNNIAYDTWQYVAGNSPSANTLGAMYSSEKDSTNQYRGFYDNFMSWSIQYVVDLGYSNAIPFRDYKLKMPIGLMGLASNEFCFQFAPQYNWILGPANSTFYSTFKEVYDATVPGASAHVCGSPDMASYLTLTKGQTYLRNEMIGGQSAVDYYFANTQIALAAAADSGLPGGTDGWTRSQWSGIHPDYRDAPTYALIPRGTSTSTPSVTLAASPSSVVSGGSSVLSWSSNATSCTASGQWSGSKATSGTETLNNITSASTFTLTCSGDERSGSATAVIAIANEKSTSRSGIIDPSGIVLLLALVFVARLRRRI